MMELQPSMLSSDAHLHAVALATGFSALQPGMESFRDTLETMVARANGPLAEPQKAFGPLYVRFSRDLSHEEGFAPFRAVLRECILSNWAYDRGEVLLGEPVVERRLHSVVTAARELGMTAALADAILTDAGAFPQDDRRTYNRKVFSVQTYEDLLAEIPTWVGPGEMMAAMGVTKRAFATLEEDGVLIPRTRAPKVIVRWRLSDGQALVSRLSAVSRLVPSEDVGWESLQHAHKRKGVAVGHLIALALSGKMALGQDNRIPGYNGFRVRVVDINALAAERDSKGTMSDALSNTISAAEFGRSVGLRDGGYLQALVEAGQVHAQKMQNPKTKIMQYRMTQAHVAEFHRKFLTTTTIGSEFGLHRNRILAVLRAADVQPFTLDGRLVGSIWLRDEVERYFSLK